MSQNKKNIVAIVQARMGASRLPNKMMLWLHGYPVIEWVRQRLGQAKMIDETVFALPDTQKDDVLAAYLGGRGAKVFRGHEIDVLRRFYETALNHEATHVVRVCADNPLIAPEEVDNLVRFYFSHPCDYAYNHIPRKNTYPDGLGAEIASLELLEKLHRKAKLASHREHIFNYIWENRDVFSIKTFDPPNQTIAHPEVKLDIDTFEDYAKFLARPLDIRMNSEEIISLFKEKE